MPILSDEEFARLYGQTQKGVVSDDDFAQRYGSVEDAVTDRFGEPPQGPVSRFMSGVGRSIDPRPVLSGLIGKPLSQMRHGDFSGAGRTFMDTARGLSDATSPMPTQERLQSALDARQRGDTLGAAIAMQHPFIRGPVERARSGDVAGAAGEVTGLVAGPKGMKGAGVLGGKIAPVLSRSAQADAIAAAKATPVGETINVRAGAGALQNPKIRGMATNTAAREGLGLGPKQAGSHVELRGGATTPPKSVPRVLTESAAKGLLGETVIGPMLPGAASAAVSLQTIGKLRQTPAWNRISAATKSRAAEMLAAGQEAEAAQMLTLAAQQIAYTDNTMRQGGRPFASGSQLTSTGHEFPTSPSRNQIFADKAGNPRGIAQLLPDGFAKANAVRELPPNAGLDRYGIGGLFGAYEDPAQPSGLGYDPKNRRNTVVMSPALSTDTAGRQHELGHAVWYQDLRDDQRAAFEDRLIDVVEQFRTTVANDPAALQRVVGQLKARGGEKWTIGLPHAIVQYYLRHGTQALSDSKLNPSAVAPEAFAELFGQYMSNPEEFRRAYPRDYELIHGIVASGYRQR